MNFEVRASRRFTSEIKQLSKKYRSLKGEFEELIDSLEDNPTQGTPIGKSCYKIRVGIASKGRGKSGGGRVITYVITERKEVVLLTIYDKQMKESLSPSELNALLKEWDLGH